MVPASCCFCANVVTDEAGTHNLRTGDSIETAAAGDDVHWIAGLVLHDRGKLESLDKAVAFERQIIDRRTGIVLAHIEVRQAIVS